MRLANWREWVVSGALLCGACASAEPHLVASNCDKADNCATQALHIDSLDILLVIDDSASLAPQAAALKAQLPRLLTAVTTGGDEQAEFPPVNSVHVAVTTTDMGIGNDSFHGCIAEDTHDGVFIRPGDVGVTCDVSHPGYLAFEGGPAPVATADTVACVPLLFSEAGDPTTGVGQTTGCGFEQPMEATLKALWPAADDRVSFLTGEGHGDTDNAGFLRDNSLLVVVVVTDEDDCSAENLDLFDVETNAGPLGPVNLRCGEHADYLYAVQRYVTNLQQLRPGNDNIVFAVVGGVPEALVADDFRSHYDMSKPAEANAYYRDVLADARMQLVPVIPDGTPESADFRPSCTSFSPAPPNTFPDPVEHRATPPRRLVQIAQGFGSNGVLGSICSSDFGSTTGSVIHAIGQKLVNAAQR